jgi:hypothetical protein
MPSRKRRAPRPAAPPEVLPPEPEEGALQPVVDDNVIASVYEEIRSLQRDATIDLAVKMGELIVKRFYGGRLDAWREHGPKESSLRKLAAKFEDDESGMSAAGIYRVVAIYELDQRLSVSSRKQLTVTHIRAVLGLPLAEQERLQEASSQTLFGWSTLHKVYYRTSTRRSFIYCRGAARRSPIRRPASVSLSPRWLVSASGGRVIQL